MSPERGLLVERFLDGSLSAAESAELLELLAGDAELRGELADAMHMAGLADSALRPATEYRQLAETVTRAVSGSAEGNHFASRVMRRLARLPGIGRAPASRREARRRGSPRWTVYAAAALALVGAGMLGLLYRDGRGPAWRAELASVEGRVALRRHGAELAARVGAPLLDGDGIETGADGRATLRCAGEATGVSLDSDSRVRLAGERGAKRLFLDRGFLRARVVAQPPGKALVLVTPHARAEVVGTAFTLEARSDRTRLEVEAGRVRLSKVEGGAPPVLVEGGWFAVAAPGVEVVAGPLAPPAGPVGPKPPAAVAFRRDFEALQSGEYTPNDLVRLPEPGGEVTAIASRPFVGGTPEWKPDEYIEICGRGASGEAEALYAVPEGIEIRFRLRSEKPGKCYFAQQRLSPQSFQESLASENFDVGPEWRDCVLRAGELKPYRRPGVHTPDMVTGMEIGGVDFYGFGTGRMYVDRIEVVSAPGAGADR